MDDVKEHGQEAEMENAKEQVKEAETETAKKKISFRLEFGQRQIDMGPYDFGSSSTVESMKLKLLEGLQKFIDEDKPTSLTDAKEIEVKLLFNGQTWDDKMVVDKIFSSHLVESNEYTMLASLQQSQGKPKIDAKPKLCSCSIL